MTQKKIARRLGVSASLVSRALSGKASRIRASLETVQRIREEAAKLHYHPNTAALTLRGAPTHTLGVIVKSFDDPFFGHMIGELQRLAWVKHFSLLLTGRIPDQKDAVDLASLLKHQIDGLIVAGSDFEPDGLDVFQARGVPMVQIGAGTARRGMVRIGADQMSGLQQLVGYLKRLGHRDIGYVGEDAPTNLRREEILRQILRREKLGVHPRFFVRVPSRTKECGYTAMSQLLKCCDGRLPTAVVAASDDIAQGALRALYEKNLRVPDDLSLVGIDDIPSARMMVPALTTLRLPVREMVRAAFKMVTERKTGRAVREVIIKPKLVLRESCARPSSFGQPASLKENL